MPTPNDIAHINTPRPPSPLERLAKEAIFLMNTYIKEGYDLDTAVALTDITLDRHDNH